MKLKFEDLWPACATNSPITITLPTVSLSPDMFHGRQGSDEPAVRGGDKSRRNKSKAARKARKKQRR